MVVGVYDTLSLWLLNLVDWGRGIIVFLIVMEIFKGIKGPAGAAVVGKGIGKGFQKYLNHKSKRYAKRAMKKEMNELIMEEVEEERLNGIKHTALEVVAILEVLKKEQIPSQKAKKFPKVVERLGDRIKGAEKYFRGLNRRTIRAQKGLKRLFDYMKKEGAQDADLVQKVQAYERTILKLHTETADELVKVEKEYTRILRSNAMDILREEAKGNNVTPESHVKAIKDLSDDFNGIEPLLEDAYKRQTGAKQAVVALMAITRNLT